MTPEDIKKAIKFSVTESGPFRSKVTGRVVLEGYLEVSNDILDKCQDQIKDRIKSELLKSIYEDRRKALLTEVHKLLSVNPLYPKSSEDLFAIRNRIVELAKYQ